MPWLLDEQISVNRIKVKNFLSLLSRIFRAGESGREKGRMTGKAIPARPVFATIECHF